MLALHITYVFLIKISIVEASGIIVAVLRAQDARATVADRRVDPAALEGRHKGRASKEERLARVHEGREGREFGSAAARKKQKTGGTSNKQKVGARSLRVRCRGHACCEAHTVSIPKTSRHAACCGMCFTSRCCTPGTRRVIIRQGQQQ